MKIGYETNVFGDSPRHGIMDWSWNGLGSRVFRLSLLSLSALCVCVELHRGSPMRFQSVVGKAMARISSGELNPCPCPQLGAKQ